MGASPSWSGGGPGPVFLLGNSSIGDRLRPSVKPDCPRFLAPGCVLSHLTPAARRDTPDPRHPPAAISNTGADAMPPDHAATARRRFLQAGAAALGLAASRLAA